MTTHPTVRTLLRSVESQTGPRCGLCHEPCDRARRLVDVGPRFLHPDCEKRMVAMGYGVADVDRRVGGGRRTAA